MRMLAAALGLAIGFALGLIYIQLIFGGVKDEGF